MSFTFDRLIDQIIAGVKTASTERVDNQGEVDEWDSAMEVGAVYTVYDSKRVPRCKIRITSIRLCQWSDIPEWLWRGEGNSNAEEFREDHDSFFDFPGADFEFVGYEFCLLSVL